MKTIRINEVEYNVENANKAVKAHLEIIQFVNDQILQKNNELQVVDTAKMQYVSELKRELAK